MRAERTNAAIHRRDEMQTVAAAAGDDDEFRGATFGKHTEAVAVVE